MSFYSYGILNNKQVFEDIVQLWGKIYNYLIEKLL